MTLCKVATTSQGFSISSVYSVVVPHESHCPDRTTYLLSSLPAFESRVRL